MWISGLNLWIIQIELWITYPQAGFNCGQMRDNMPKLAFRKG